MDDLSRFCCQNPRCADFGKRGARNLTACGYSGKAKKFRLLYCRTCRARFSERKGTPLFNSRVTRGKKPVRAGAHCRRVRSSENGTAVEVEPGSGGPTLEAGGRSGAAVAR